MNAITPDLHVPALSVETTGVLGKLEATRRDMRQLQFWLGMARLLLTVVVLGAALVFADWMWVLPTAVRALGLMIIVGLAACLQLKHRIPYGRTQAAVEVETRFPELGQRLRTVVDYAAPKAETVPASAALLTALGRDTEHRSSRLDFRKLIPWAAFERGAVAVFFVSASGLVALFLNPELRTAALRMLLFPVHYTALDVEPGDLTLKAGEELKLTVTLNGRPVSSAHWSYRQKSNDKWVSAALAPASPPLALPSQGGENRPLALPGGENRPLVGALTTSLKDCQADLDYRVVAGELESRVFHVRVVHPLVLKEVAATISPPVYTRRPPEVVKEGSFKAIEGSSVQISVTLDHAPKTAALVLGLPDQPTRQTVPLEIEGAKLTGILPPITADLQYEIAAADDDGMKLEADPFRIKVRLDEKPTVRFIRPDESLGVTPITEVPIQVEARDDFGVTRVGICYKIGDGPEETLHVADYQDRPITAEALTTLYLEKHKLTYDDGIAYYAFVEDNYVPQPHRVVSELRFIDIVPFKQEFRLVEGEGSCNGSSTTLEELIARQRTNLNRTFAFERDQTVPDEIARRLAKYEEELAAATAEFAQGMGGIAGPRAALDEAALAMRSATESLTAKDLPSARPREEAALKGLISARQNLRKLLKLSSSSQASACRKFDRQQTQKIRRPPHDESKHQLARLENDLKELARKEQKFSEQIEPRGGGGAELEPAPQNKQPAESPQKPASKSSSNGSSSSSAGNSSQASQPKTSVKEQQRQAALEAERLRQLARTDEALTELTNRRLEDAAEAVQEANRSIDGGRPAESAKAARDAARKLESVARQVGALKARELADRLARQRDLAQAIARAERELGQAVQRKDGSKETGPDDGKRLAERQRELAEEVAALADVLKRLEMSAAEVDRELAETIDRAARANPPEEVEDSMRRNADAISGGRTAQAAQDAQAAAQQLEALAGDLESARRASIAPQLERLLAAEKQAAELQEKLRSVRQSSQQAEVEKGLSDLARLLEDLAPGGGSLNQATDKLANAIRSSHSGWTRNDRVQHGEGGYFEPPVVYSESLGGVILALQAKIQEIVLDNALVERTGPVPPQYKDLVDDYYRVLSQDLR